MRQDEDNISLRTKARIFADAASLASLDRSKMAYARYCAGEAARLFWQANDVEEAIETLRDVGLHNAADMYKYANQGRPSSELGFDVKYRRRDNFIVKKSMRI